MVIAGERSEQAAALLKDAEWRQQSYEGERRW